MTVKERNQAQIKEALSDVNRYYYWLKYGKSADNDGQLILFYIENGGARDFANKNKDSR